MAEDRRDVAGEQRDGARRGAGQSPSPVQIINEGDRFEIHGPVGALGRYARAGYVDGVGIEPASTPFWNVPNRNPFFTGREALLAELEGRLGRDGSAVLNQTQAISGLGGVGKTQTAIEFCHRHREAFPGGVFWTTATSGEALESELARLAHEVGLVGLGVPVDEAAGAFRRHLSGLAGWLLVLDNADSADDLRPLLPRLVSGRVLVTTRRQEDALGSPLGVEVLDPDEAVALLLRRASRGEAEREVALELVGELGYLPLAIEQAGSYLGRRRVELAAYLESFRERRLGLLSRGEPKHGDYHATVSTTWQIGFAELEKESAPAASALRACGFLAPEGIPLELFEQAGGEVHPELGSLDDPLAVHEVLVEPLTRYSLATYSEGGRTLSVHRLVQEVIRQEVEVSGRTFEVLDGAHRALDVCFPRDIDSPESWPAAERLLAHVQAGVELWEAHLSEEHHPTILWMWVGDYLWRTGRSSVALALERRCVAVWETLLGPEHPSTLRSMNNLAATLQSLGDLSGSRDLHESVLEARRRVLGPEHPDTLSSMNNLAETLRALGDLSGSRDLHESVLEARRRVLGPEHPDTLSSMNNLAETLHYLGDLSGSRALHESELEICRRVLGPEHPDTLISMHNLLCTQSDSADVEVDQGLLSELLAGVRGLPEGVPIREAALKQWGSDEEGSG